MHTLPTAPETLPAWTNQAIALLSPTLGVMAKPVIINNLKRVAAGGADLQPAEVPLFLEKVRRGIVTFAAEAQADELVTRLRLLLPW